LERNQAAANLGEDFRFPGSINKPMPARDHIKNMSAMVECCYLALLSGLLGTLLVNQLNGLLHHFADKQRVISEHS